MLKSQEFSKFEFSVLLIPRVMVLGDGVLGGDWIRKGGARMMGLVPLRGETPQGLLPLCLLHVRIQYEVKRSTVCKPGRGHLPDTNLPAP